MNTKWEVKLDFENESPWVRPDRPWNKWREEMPKTIGYQAIPIFELPRAVSEEFPNNVAVYFVPEEKKYTYRELMEESDKVAAALADLGVKKGDSVGIMTFNRPEFLFGLYGALETGASCTLINPLLTKRDVEYILKDAGIINTLIVQDFLYPNLREVGGKVKLKNVIVIGKEKYPDTLLFDEFIKRYPPKPPKVEINPKEDIAALLYTGGTTGLPKGVMLTHFNLVSNGLVARCAEPERWKEQRGKGVMLVILPVCHSFGFLVVTMVVDAASMMVMMDFDPPRVLDP